MRNLFALFIFATTIHAAAAQDVTVDSPDKNNPGAIHRSVEQPPEFPGGLHAFYTYLGKNLKYPEVARLLGITGKVNVSFVVDTSGRVIEVAPNNCIGAGCESEAARLVENSPKWQPGLQDSKPVRVHYTVPIDFSLSHDDTKFKTSFKTLKRSHLGFVFSYKGQLYNIEEAQKLLGDSFLPEQVTDVELFYNYDNIEKFNMPDKTDVYLVILKPI